MFTLIELDEEGQPAPRRWRLEQSSVSLGASPRCDVTLPDVSLPPVCARIQRRARYYFLQPVGSGGLLRAEQEVVTRPLRLRSGLRFQVGGVQLLFRLGDHSAQETERSDGALEQLRALLYADPSREAWEALCALFDRWPASQSLEVGVDYAVAHLARWPRPLCAAPERWRQRLLAGWQDPRLRLPRVLDLGDVLTNPTQMENLRRCPQLAQVEALVMPRWSFDDQLFALFLQAPSLQRLRSLKLTAEELTDRSALAMASCEQLRGLHELSLAPLRITAQALLALLQSPVLASLRALEVQGARDWRHGLDQLLGPPYLPALSSLRLRGCRLQAEHFAALPGLTACPALERLDLSQNRVQDEGAASLARSPLLAHLTELDLAENGITDEGAVALAASPWTRRLRRLRLSGNPVGQRGVEALAQSPSMRYLLSLEV